MFRVAPLREYRPLNVRSPTRAPARPRLFPAHERASDGEVVGAAAGFVRETVPRPLTRLAPAFHGHHER